MKGNKMEFIVVTGLSGAGKSKTLEVLEDIGFYCVDNMPPALIPRFAEICFQSGGKIEKVALVTDVRGGEEFLSQLLSNLSSLKSSGFDYTVLFLDANDGTLLKRYKETRRKHPLADGGKLALPRAIEKERIMLDGIKKISDYIVDTSSLKPNQLRDQILRIFVDQKDIGRGLVINVVSFGFKYGIPVESDLVFDLRFLPNPYYIDELKDMTGLDSKVYDYVFSFDQTTKFAEMLTGMMEFLIPYYINEGKTSLVIAIGCTGGKHRSVSIAQYLGRILEKNYFVSMSHRDILKV